MFEFVIFPLVCIYSIVYLGFLSLTDNFVLSLSLLSIVTVTLIYLLEPLTATLEKREALLQEVFKPQIAAIKGNSTGAQQHDRLTRLYRRYGYNPLFAVRSATGVLLQLPFLFGAYFMLANLPLLAGQSWGVIADLSQPDALLGEFNLLPCVMLAISLLNTMLSTRSWDRARKQGLVIATLFFVFLYAAPSALLIYWTGNNVLYLCRTVCRKLPWATSWGQTVRTIFSPVAILSLAVLLVWFNLSGVDLFIRNPQDYQSNLWTFRTFFAGKSLHLAVLVLIVFLGVCRFKLLSLRLGWLIVGAVIAAMLQDALFNETITVLDGREKVRVWSLMGISASLMWLTILVVPQLFNERLKRYFPAVTLGVLGLLFMNFQIPHLHTLKTLEANPIPSEKHLIMDLAEGFEFSRNHLNVVLIMTDTFSGTMAKTLFEDKALQAKYDGFTLLTDYVAAFPTTIASVGALLSGQTYDNAVPLRDLYRNTEDETLQASLKSRGFKTVLGKEMVLWSYKTPKLFDNLHYGEQKPKLSLNEANNTLNGMTFKFLPPFLKQSNLLSSISKFSFASISKPQGWDFDFIDHIENDFKATNTVASVFSYSHLVGAHPPHRINSNFKEGRTSEMEQSKASLLAIAELIEKLKATDVFKNTIFFITADHPDLRYQEKTIVGLLHTPASLPGFQTSDVPLAITSVKALIEDAVHNPNEPVSQLLTRHSASERIFRDYRWDDGWTKAFLPKITEYEIKGVAYKAENYRVARTIYPGVKMINQTLTFVLPDDLEAIRYSFSESFKQTSSGMLANDEARHRNMVSLLLNPPKGVKFILTIDYLDEKGKMSTLNRKVNKEMLFELTFEKGSVIKKVDISELQNSLTNNGSISVVDIIDLPGDPNAYGWHGFEGSHTWSAAEKAGFDLNLSPANYTVILQVAPLHSNVGKVTVRVGQQKWEAPIQQTTEVKMKISPKDFDGDSVKVLIECEKVLTPHSLGINEDRRTLGVALRGISIHTVSKSKN